MSRNNIRYFQNNDFEVVRGDSLIMPFRLKLFSPLNYSMELDIIDPFTKEVIPMASGTSYSKRRNANIREGIYYNNDSGLWPSGVVLTSDNEVAIKLDINDTLLLSANQTYRYGISISRADGTLKRTFIQGAIQVLRSAKDV